MPDSTAGNPAPRTQRASNRPTYSPNLGDLAGALSKAQAEIKNAAKDAANPHLNSSYATLASCWAACRGPLTANGLSVIQSLAYDPDSNCVRCTTLLAHVSGQWAESTLALPVGSKVTPQTVGSASTYARRYGLCAAVGIAPGDDDDGHTASAAPSAPVRRASRPQVSGRPGNRPDATGPNQGDSGAHDESWEPARRWFMGEIAKLSWDYKDLTEFLAWLGRPRPSAMTDKQRTALLQWLDSEASRAKYVDWRAAID